jgi:hypothetical protein
MRRAVHDNEHEALTSSTEMQGDHFRSQGNRQEVHKDAQDENEVQTAWEKQDATQEVQAGQLRDKEHPLSQRG